MDKYKYIALAIFYMALSGCGVHNVEHADPIKYHRAADYADDVVNSSGCIGKIDNLIFKSGRIFVNEYGLNYSSDNANLHCAKRSFIEAMSLYCQSKSGQFSNGWCSVGDNPLFKVDGFTTLEKSPSQSAEEWAKSSRQYGYESKRWREFKESERKYNEMMKKERITKEKNIAVDAEIGDLICREDYEAPPYQYPGVAYYKAYVEKKGGNKLQLRLVWHGGNGFVVDDITNTNNIIWSSPKGWHHCN